VFFKPNNQDKEYRFSQVELDSNEPDFTRYFTFNNPQDRYPHISQERWEQITALNVRKGFTAEEVRIAFGNPRRIYTEDDDETWFYTNINRRDYVVSFKDGVVDRVVSQTR
jgi:hypothetical protein